MNSDGTDKPIHYQTATTLLEMLGSGQISSVELTDHFIARIEALDPVINAVVVRTFDAAREAAQAADAARAQGRSLGALHGLPMTVKESFGLAGTPTTFGFPPSHRISLDPIPWRLRACDPPAQRSWARRTFRQA